MLTGIYLVDIYKSTTTLDPARLGAQVVSGIGFLGAGTIIKEGVTVKGLTTAASLWAVAGIGLACGAGFYFGAAIATIIILISLIVFNNIDKIHIKSKYEFWIELLCDNKPGLIGKIGTYLGSVDVEIRQISLAEKGNEEVIIRLLIKMPRRLEKIEVYENVKKITGIKSIK